MIVENGRTATRRPQRPRRGRGRSHGRKRPGILRRLLVLLLGLVIFCAVLGGFAYWNVFLKAAVDVAPGLPVQVEIAEGDTTAEIAEQLAQAGIVANANMFRFQASNKGLDADLRTGVYDLYTGMPYDDVFEQLTAGPPITYVTVTIPEGFTIEQIASRVGETTGLSADTFAVMALEGGRDWDYSFLATNETASLEGYLFPKTYRIPEGSTEEDVLRMMLEQFEREIDGIDLTFVQEMGLSSHDWVTLASMIEREVRVADERVLVSSVIYNRLVKGMRLEIDATIEYILPGTRPRLLNSHLQIDSPYNTYMYAGLPPGPIASPGLAALQAAASPAQTNYLYYVLTSEDGSHTFTETYSEFLDAKERSREIVP